MRTGTCELCKAPFDAPPRGRVPEHCIKCRDPQTLRQTVRILTMMAKQAQEPMFAPGADRQMLVRAIQAVATASGRTATYKALIRLRDVAGTWAAILELTEKQATGRDKQTALKEVA